MDGPSAVKRSSSAIRDIARSLAADHTRSVGLGARQSPDRPVDWRAPSRNLRLGRGCYFAVLMYSTCVQVPVIEPGKTYSPTICGFTSPSAGSQKRLIDGCVTYA